MSFTHLHVHSRFSMLEGASGVKELCARAAREGLSALALTDTGGLYGAVPFVQAAKAAGLRPILGTDLKVLPGAEGRAPRGEGGRPRMYKGLNCRRAVLLATSSRGYESLCRLVTAYHMREGFRLRDQVCKDGEGIALLSDDPELLDALARDRGPRDLFVELCAWKPWMRLVPFVRRSGLSALATNNVHFASPEDHPVHHLLVAIRHATSLSAVPVCEVAPPAAHLASAAAMEHVFADFPEAIANAADLAERCDFELPLGKLKLPRFLGWGGRMNGGEPPADAFELLRAECLAGARWRYGRVRDYVRRQLDHELAIIAEMGYADYFLVVADIARFAHSRGIPTCGRGSAANSIVAYALGLTHVEPLAHHLFFERFLNRGRSDAPDVDLDFSWRDRATVLDYVFRAYGEEHVAMISTHVCLEPRAAVWEVGKVFGLPAPEIHRLTRRMPWGWGARPGEDLAEAVRASPSCQGLDIEGEPWATIFRLAEKIEGAPRHLGVHAGGILISPTPLTDSLPCERAAKGLAITQWDMHPVEDAGLVKIDLLGNRSLAVIQDGAREAETHGAPPIDLTSFDPTGDEATREIIRRGETMGCFYIESPAMRGLLKKLRCDDYETLVAASSIIRPGIAASGMMRAYIERFHGAPFTHLHPKMAELLAGTYGVMVYQEDVIKVAHAIAGMSHADADGLRKSMSKKRNYERIERYREIFTRGAIEGGCTSEVATELWRQIESFAGYSFCKAHSASYALISFQAAYLRAHHSAEFMAAVLSNHGGYYTTFAYVAECRRMGLEVRLPDLNESEEAWTGRGNEVRVGLSEIQGLTEEGRQAIVEERHRGGAYRSLEDLLARVRLKPTEAEAFVRCGALDSIASGASRAALAWRLIAWRRANGGGMPAVSLGLARAREASEPCLPLDTPAALPTPPAHDRVTQLRFEYETLGFLVSAHPLELFPHATRGRRLALARDLDQHLGRSIELLGWLVTAKLIDTVKGEPMEFISFEDTTALYEAAFFPDAYRSYASILVGPGPYLLRGVPESDFGHVTLTVHQVERVPRFPRACLGQARKATPSPAGDRPLLRACEEPPASVE